MARESDMLRGVAVGAGSAILALGVGEFLGVALADASLVASVGDVAVDLAPGWLVRRTIGILGVAQKPVLLTGIVCVAVVLGGWVGSRGTSGRIALGLAGLLGALAVLRSGAGYYLSGTHPDDMDDRSVDDLAFEIVSDVREGIDGTGVRAGVIGEIGCTYPWLPNEKKSLRAAVAAQVETGAPLMVHPGRDPMSPVEIAEIVDSEGGDLSRTTICHIDRTCTDRSWLADMAATGCYLEYDLFGNESSWYPPNPAVDMPSDAERMDVILWHFEHGLEGQVLLSHDIATKHRLHAYGGLGYDHLVTNVVPRLRRRGLSEADVRTLIVDNPARIFAFTTGQ